jgi:thiamine-monophosphate kinase
LAMAIRNHAAAAMDVSDGLLGDAVKLAAAAGHAGHHVVPRIDLARVPMTAAVRDALGYDPSLLKTVVTGGDDYEILMAVAPEALPLLGAACLEAGCMVSVIGELIVGTSAMFIGLDGTPQSFETLKFEHDFKA